MLVLAYVAEILPYCTLFNCSLSVYWIWALIWANYIGKMQCIVKLLVFCVVLFLYWCVHACKPFICLLSCLVYICADTRCHPGDSWGISVFETSTRWYFTSRECRRLPCQPSRTMEPGNRHWKSSQNGRRGPQRASDK